MITGHVLAVGGLSRPISEPAIALASVNFSELDSFDLNPAGIPLAAPGPGARFLSRNDQIGRI
jgi:hypothetical protein